MLRKILDLFRPKSMLVVRYNLDHLSPDNVQWVVKHLQESMIKKWGSGMDISFIPSHENSTKIVPKKRNLDAKHKRFFEIMTNRHLRELIAKK
jgi:hypothetical protein